MRTNTSYFALICLGALLQFSSCSKKENPEPKPAPVEESGQAGTDSREAQAENDNAVLDVNRTLDEYGKISGRPASPTAAKGTTICGLSVDTTGMSSGIIQLNYTGITCNNRTRTGSIKLTLQNFSSGKRWKDPGAVLQVEYLAYKIARASDGASIQFDGTQNYTNISGGTWLNLLFVQNFNLIHSVTGTNLKVTFGDNKTAKYNINRKVTYTYSSGVFSCKAEGIGNNNNISNLENYGTTRDGDAFTSEVSTPIVWNTTCGAGAPVQGAVNMKVTGKDFDMKCLFGVDKTGNPVNVGANQCPYGWKLEWTSNNVTQNKVIGYK